MNKLIKGAVSGGAAIALLLGGVGTFATWNDSTTINAGVVKSGTLKFVNSPSDGTWTINGVQISDSIGNHYIVPGDTISYTKSIAIKATGDDLKAVLGVDLSNVHPTSTAADNALAAALLSSLSASSISLSNVSGFHYDASTHTVSVEGPNTTATATATITLKFPDSSDNSTQGGRINLNNIGLTLTQVLS